MNYAEGIPGIGRKSVRRLLEDLNALRQKNIGVEGHPLLSLHLRTGQEICGWLLDYGLAEGSAADASPVVVLHRALPDVRQPADAVLVVAVNEVQAVTVYEASGVARRFLPPLTRMDLRRLAEKSQVGQSWTLVLELEQVEENDFPAAADGVRAFQSALAKLQADAMGRQALTEKVRRIILRTGTDCGAALDQDALTVTLSLPNPSDPEAVKNAIEAVL